MGIMKGSHAYSKAFISALCISVLFSACVNRVAEESGEVAGQSIPFSFVGHVSKMASLRMEDDSFEEGDSVGVFALAGSSSLEEERYFDNECFVRSSGSLFTAADPLFYPDGQTPLDIISYYPYSPQGIAPGESALAVSVQADQGIAGNYPKSDFLVAEKTGQHASMEPVDLEYRHKFFRLSIVLSPNGGVTAEELLDADPRVSVHGFYTKAAYDFSDSTYVGYLDEAVVSPAGAWSVEDGELSGKHAILIPQETTAGYQYIMLEVKGKRYKCWLPDELELIEGKQCRLRISFEAEEDVLLGSLSGEISSWVDGEDTQATSEPLRKYISIASLDFTQSCVFNVLDGTGSRVGEICKEYLLAPGVSAQAIVFYPAVDGGADLSRGTAVSVLGSPGDVHGGSVSWDVAGNTLRYTPGHSGMPERIYFHADGQISTAVSGGEEPRRVMAIAEILRDTRGGSIRNYPLVKIGTQYWMRESLAASAYTDGSGLPQLPSMADRAFGYIRSGARDYFYTALAVLSGRLFPDGWRIPSSEDWCRLRDYLGNDAGLLKSGSWGASPEPFGNLSGFGAEATGFALTGGDVDSYSGKYAGFWTMNSDTLSLSFMLTAESDTIVFGGSDPYNRALSLRGIRE